MRFTLADLQSFDAVVREGGFQPAAAVLNRTHPTIFSAVAKLEHQLGIELLDRSGYRVRPTEAGRSFHRKTQAVLRAAKELDTHAQQLAQGIEPALRIVIGDLAPRQQVLKLLSHFFGQQATTRLDLSFEAVTGPWERLFDDDADLIIHRVDKTDARLEWIDLATVKLIPVVAPNFLPFPVEPSLSLEDMRDATQCIIRDTARHSLKPDHLVLEGVKQCTVADHQMKKEIIVQGMAWGHLPSFLVDREIEQGQLLSLVGHHFTGVSDDLVIARRTDRPHGPIAEQLWSYMKENAACIQSAAGHP